MSNLYFGLVFLVGLVATGLLLAFIFSRSGTSKEVFQAIDGSTFSTKKACNEYEFLYSKLRFLYEEAPTSYQRDKKKLQGLSLGFVKQIKSNGFKDPNALISNKEQFKKLVELLDVSDMPNDYLE
ncbi:hypothetical protein [Prochlorococcus marinus]|uniref:hypothetical protein n=1 Tax=Prochlorococcus marinus TaxID=1219 RepID=UPI0022B32CFB|nr:hypothetical protein [Prochlorococcus marinus]